MSLPAQLSAEELGWIVFAAVVAAAHAVDLFFFSRRARAVSIREAFAWSFVWVGLAAAFGVVIWLLHGPDRAGLFATGYLLEESLSVDNLFVFLLVFRYFKVPPESQSRALRWGILGAFVLRGIAIVGGTELMRAFDWLLYFMGALLLYTAARLVLRAEEEVKLESTLVIRLARRLFPVAPVYDGARFVTRVDGRLRFTLLFLVAVVLDFMDLVFAMDSIPAVFGVTLDKFVIYTSNVFAILGLRVQFFLISRVMDLFRFLRYGLAVILAFVGVKILLKQYITIPTWVSLAVVGGVLALSIALSVLICPPGGSGTGDASRLES